LKKKPGERVVSNTDGSPLIGPSEVARLLGVSSGWVRDHATRKLPRIPVVRIGKLMRFRITDINVIVQHGFSSENWRTNGEEF
jgi:hypothetical protein